MPVLRPHSCWRNTLTVFDSYTYCLLIALQNDDSANHLPPNHLMTWHSHEMLLLMFDSTSSEHSQLFLEPSSNFLHSMQSTNTLQTETRLTRSP